MKMNYLSKIAAMLVLCCAMLSCQKDNTTTTIYGTVFNSVTHEPIVGAQIEVGYRFNMTDYRISSSVSGTDGQFELQFGEVQMPNHIYSGDYFRWYYISGTSDGYFDNYQQIGITIGSNYRMDVNLDPR